MKRHAYIVAVIVATFFIPSVSLAFDFYNVPYDDVTPISSFHWQEYSWSGSDCSTVPNWTISSITASFRGQSGTAFVDAAIGTFSDYSLQEHKAGDEQSQGTGSFQEHTWNFSPSVNLRQVCVDDGDASGAVRVGIGMSSGVFSSTSYYNDSTSENGVYRYVSGTDSGRDYSAIFSGVEPDTSSRISSLSPVNATTTASTTVDIDVSYYASSEDPYTKVGYYITNLQTWNIDYSTTTSVSLDTDDTFSTSVVLNEGGYYSLYAFLSNDDGTKWVYSRFDTTEGVATDGTANFSVVTNDVSEFLGVDSLDNTWQLATSTCSVANVTGCFQNALVWTFYPSKSAMDRLVTAGNSVRHKPPFGYIFAYTDAIGELSATGTAMVVLATSTPIVTYIFSPIDTALGVMIFFFFAVWFVMHIRHLDI